MGSILSKSRIEFIKSNPREFGFLIWLLLVTALQIKQKLQTPKDERKRSISFRGTKFTKTNGGKTDLSWFGTMEYWMVSIIRGVECYGMMSLGEKYFLKNKMGVGSFGRMKILIWAAYSLLPVMDLLVPEDWSNPEDQHHRKKLDFKFRLPLYFWTIAEMYTTAASILAISNPKLGLTTKERIAVLITLGMFNGGVGINTSHELLHKSSTFEKILGYCLLMNVNYMHWGEEHLSGHHQNVATPDDPASARLNETFYEFFPRTLIGTWKSSLNLELSRLESQGISKWNLWQNRMAWNTLLPLLWGLTLVKLSGNWKALKYFYIQGFLSASLLELVNYIEHYGLSRDKLENGQYEPVNPTHSWNAPHRLSNSILYKLQRHSDHHTYALREYQYLRNFQESPQLPNGYMCMILMALFPPLYFHIMNPLVKAAKVKPENYNSEGFSKDAKWIEAERVARSKTTAFAIASFVVGTVMLKKVS